MDDLAAKTLTLLKPYLKRQAATIALDARLIDLGIDRLDLPILALDIEDAFDIDVSSDEMQRLVTIGAVIDRIRLALAARRQARKVSACGSRRADSAWLKASRKH